MMRMLASRACTLKELALEFEVSPRQVHRDLGEIEAEGHPLTALDEPGEKLWQLPLGYKGLPQIAISPYELMSLHMGKSHLAYLNSTPFVDDLDSVIAKVEAGLPAKVANHLERISRVFAPMQVPVRSYGKQKEVLNHLRKALLLQRTVILDHCKPGFDKPVAHRVDPYVLLLYQCGLYVAGYSHRAKALRMFAIERIRGLDLSEHRFEMPADFSWESQSGRLFGLIEEPSKTVRIWFSPDVAYLMKERQWHPTQSLKQQKDRSVVVTFQAGGLDEMTSWVLSWGADAKVLSPPELIESVRSRLEAARKQYSPSK
ncbi:helix-turn-helix transcriptional regulator [Nitrospira moscoviensis]|uniref:Helix-turn-helix, type 11 domain protein n=1 Tax=Nitrospira moscoviensis TaxID=42253 RepID=A0A0K2GGA2_NITMO|nr:WYL domain-containing transcriptional regulator [Nitrospira moscoviensis]ALA59980.1 Helix-turn-helix, type 11 domain protein [Nitrospira moscoviensis]